MIKFQKRRKRVGTAAGNIALLFLTALFSIHGNTSYGFAAPSSIPVNPGSAKTEQEIEKKVVSNIREALNRIKPFKVNFVQQVLADDLATKDILDPTGSKNLPEADIEEKGDIIFNNDRQLKWTYLEPDFKVFLLEDNRYQFYDEDNEQVQIGTVKDRNQQWIWQLLFSQELFQSRTIGWDPAKRILGIKGGEVELNLAVDINFLPVKALQYDPTTGSRVFYYFNSYQSKIKIDEKTFKLDIPEGVDVIREEDR